MKKTEPESYDFSDMGETVGIIGESGPNLFFGHLKKPYAGAEKAQKNCRSAIRIRKAAVSFSISVTPAAGRRWRGAP
jgi:hypothetical protein